MEKLYTSGDVQKILNYSGARQNILSAEKAGIIPEAERGRKRSKQTRVWGAEALPKIGQQFGAFEPLDYCPIIATYQAKGGILKTNLVLNLARTLAIGLRATKAVPNPRGLILGLDSQSSISFCLTNPVSSLNNLSDWHPPLTIADYFHKTASLDEIIVPTDLPSLDLIPESIDLSNLEKELGTKTMRHKSFQDLIAKLKKKYQFVLLDLSPNFSALSEASLFSSDLHLFPASCEIGCYSVMNSNYSMIEDFFETIDAPPTPKLIVPTMLANNKISRQIHQTYLTQYSSEISMSTISSKVVGGEAESLGISVREYSPKSTLADEYFNLAVEMWEKLEELGNL